MMNKFFRMFKFLTKQASTEAATFGDQREKQGKPSRLETDTSKSYFVAFDLEIAKVIPGDFTIWRSQRPLGISCAALQFDGYEPELWFTRSDNCEFSERMSREDSIKLVDRLAQAVDMGWKILTWNGLGFDFDILAEESGCWEVCKNLALNHVDMMFHFFCVQGYPLSLDKAAKGLGLSGKQVGMTGDLAPILWQQGKQPQVLEYVAQDVRTTMDVAKSVARCKRISWTSNRGYSQQVFLPQGWLRVTQAMKLPHPDNSWMSNPMSRNDFLQWTTESNNPVPSEKNIDLPNMRTLPSKEEYQRSSTQIYLQNTHSEDEINALLSLCNFDPDLIPSDMWEELEYHPTEDEINALLSLCNSDPDLIPSDIWEELEYHPRRNECPCPICRGTPNLDPAFLYFEELYWRSDDDE